MDTRKQLAAYITAQNDYDAANLEYRADFMVAMRLYKRPPVNVSARYLTLCWYQREWTQNTYDPTLPMHNAVAWRPA